MIRAAEYIIPSDIAAVASLDDAGYDALDPFQWPRPAGAAGPVRLFSDGRFYTPSGKALHAGTNCGSCIPELKGLLAESATSAAAPG
jgi:hypothetical protein